MPILNSRTTIIAFYTVSFQFSRSQFPPTTSTTPITHNLCQYSEVSIFHIWRNWPIHTMYDCDIFTTEALLKTGNTVPNRTAQSGLLALAAGNPCVLRGMALMMAHFN